MAFDRTTQSAHHTWDQLSRYDRPTIEIETATACVKDLQTATYAMVGVDRMVKGMDEGREQSFSEAIQAVKDINKGIDKLIRVYVQMQLTHEKEMQDAVDRTAIDVPAENDNTIQAVRTECLKEVDSMAKKLNAERIASATASRSIKELEEKNLRLEERVRNISAGDHEAKKLQDQMEQEMLKWHQRYQSQILETQSVKEELEVQNAEVVMKNGVIKNMLDDATKRVTSTVSTDGGQRLLIASLRKNASDLQKKYEDTEGALTNQKWMLEQAERTKLSPLPPSNSHVQIGELTTRANSADMALLSINARTMELEEEVKERYILPQGVRKRVREVEKKSETNGTMVLR